MDEDEWFYDMSGDIEREWDDDDDEDDPWVGLWIDRDGAVHEGDQEDEY